MNGLADSSLGLVSSVTQQILSPALAPTVRTVSYQTNRGVPNLMAPPDALIRAFQMGLISYVQLKDWLPFAGIDALRIDTGVQGQATKQQLAWRAVERATRPYPGPELFMRMWATGLLDDTQWFNSIRRTGADPQQWDGFLQAYQAVPTVGELMLARNRRIISPQEFSRGLTRNGYSEGAWRQLYDELRFVVPPVSDLIRFQVREVFDPQLASQLQLFDERPEEALEWFAQQGLDWGPGFNVVSDGQQIEAKWADLYWGAHWQVISPTQAYQMLHKLRPGRVQRYQVGGQVPAPFDVTDLNRVLRVADYPKPYRLQLAAIAYQPLRLIDIRSAFDTGARDRAWAKEQLLDRGHSEPDTEDILDLWRARKRQADLQPIRNLERGLFINTARETLSQYRDGIMARDNAEGVLTALGFAPERAVGLLNLEDERRTGARIRRNIHSVRKGFLRGVLSVAEARRRLVAFGLSPVRVAEYIEEWDLQKDGDRQRETTSQIMQWVRRGLIDTDEAFARLRNLGWEEPERLLFTRQAAQELAGRQAQALSAQQRTVRQQGATLERLARQAGEQQRRLQAELRRISPVSKLQKWLKKGLINIAFFRRRMLSMAYPPTEIELYLREVIQDVTAEEAGPAEGEQDQEATQPAP